MRLFLCITRRVSDFGGEWQSGGWEGWFKTRRATVEWNWF